MSLGKIYSHEHLRGDYGDAVGELVNFVKARKGRGRAQHIVPTQHTPVLKLDCVDGLKSTPYLAFR